MLKSMIEDAYVKQCGVQDAKTGEIYWALVHPSNGAILAYADTKDEAVAYKEAINDIPRRLRGIGFEVA